MQQKRPMELLIITNTLGLFDMRVFNDWEKISFLQVPTLILIDYQRHV